MVVNTENSILATNMVESLKCNLRNIIKNRSQFPNDEAVFKLLYLALKNIERKWTCPCGKSDTVGELYKQRTFSFHPMRVSSPTISSQC